MPRYAAQNIFRTWREKSSFTTVKGTLVPLSILQIRLNLTNNPPTCYQQPHKKSGYGT